MNTAVSILICTHNRCEILDRTLESLQRLDRPDGVGLEIIVVANACTDRTAEVVGSWIPRSNIPLRLVDEPRIGLSNARNRAVAEARFDLLAFLDDDVLVDAAWLTGVLTTFTTTDAAMVGGRVELWWEAVARPAWMIPELEDHLSRLDLGDKVIPLTEPRIVGANFTIRRRVFEDAGPYRPDLGRKGSSMVSGEETDFILKAMARGHRLYYSPLAALRHWVPPHRAQIGHLLKIIEGKSIALVLMRERFGPAQAARSLLGGIGKLALHGPRAMSGNIHARMRCAVGRGQIIGTFRRLRTRAQPPG